MEHHAGKPEAQLSTTLAEAFNRILQIKKGTILYE